MITLEQIHKMRNRLADMAAKPPYELTVTSKLAEQMRENYMLSGNRVLNTDDVRIRIDDSAVMRHGEALWRTEK